MNKLKHYLIGYSLILLINAGMLAFVCPQAKSTLKVKKATPVITTMVIPVK